MEEENRQRRREKATSVEEKAAGGEKNAANVEKKGANRADNAAHGRRCRSRERGLK